jgi:hypothetical protein
LKMAPAWTHAGQRGIIGNCAGILVVGRHLGQEDAGALALVRDLVSLPSVCMAS